MNRPRLVLTELREYRSERTGNTYFSGYLGKARVVMLRDERAECTGKEVARWNVLLEEPEPVRTERHAPAGHRARAGRPGGGQDRRPRAAAVQALAQPSTRPAPGRSAPPVPPPIARPASCCESAASTLRARSAETSCHSEIAPTTL